MLCRSAPEAKSTVAPRRAADGWHAAASSSGSSARNRRESRTTGHARKVSGRGRARPGLTGVAGAMPGDCTPCFRSPAARSAPSASCRRRDADVLPAAPRPRRSRAPSRRPRRNPRAARRAAQGHGPRSPASRAIRRHGSDASSGAIGAPASPPAGRFAACSPRPGRPPFAWSGSRSCSAIWPASPSAWCRRCAEAGSIPCSPS